MNLWRKVADLAVSAASGSSLATALRRLTMRDGPIQPDTDIRFTIALIALLAKMARSDGTVTSDEVEAFQRLVRVAPEDHANVRRVFDLARQDIAGFEDYARQIGLLFSDRIELRRDVLEGLFVIAAADGVLHEKEERFLDIVAGHLDVASSEVRHIRSMFVQDGDSPYEVLGLQPTSSDADLKSRHRQLVVEHHPDRMHGRGVPTELIVIAERKLAAINAAFDAIAKDRGL